jgi:hypothetical protein
VLRHLSLAALVGLCCACASLSDRVDYFAMAPRLEYQGFSFDRPPGPRWWFLQSEQTHTSAFLHRDTNEGGRTHSFYASVSLGSLPRQPATAEEFAQLVDPPVQKADYDIVETSRHVESVARQGQWCIRFETTNQVHGAPVAPDQELVLILRGFRCLHPAFPQTELTMFYSERGTSAELDPALSEEGEAFLRGVRIDFAPGTPAS